MDQNKYYYNWDEEKKNITYFEDGSLNIAYNVIDKHLEDGLGNKTALIYEPDQGETTTFSFFSIAKQSSRYANYIASLGVVKGDRVFIFLPRIPELYFSFLGILKTGAIAGTMFSAFQPAALKDRLGNCGAKVLFTTKELAKRIEPIKAELPELKHIVVVDDGSFCSKC